jgi:hypothetical protein
MTFVTYSLEGMGYWLSKFRTNAPPHLVLAYGKPFSLDSGLLIGDPIFPIRILWFVQERQW